MLCIALSKCVIGNLPRIFSKRVCVEKNNYVLFCELSTSKLLLVSQWRIMIPSDDYSHLSTAVLQ